VCARRSARGLTHLEAKAKADMVRGRGVCLLSFCVCSLSDVAGKGL